ncbi:DUF2993 domain-containing protein [Amycolatopsis sp. NPDC059657]|uniref:LmeA family phospholipid-binding protein n=1 Tax=Amycolatopsis sp. NPDC059657 TaxID=3346899 RepID=UPI003671B8BA
MVSRPVAQQDRAMEQPAPRRKGRRTRRLIIIFLVLAAILVGADFGMAAFAEHEISQKAREQLKLSDDPSVSIKGFPFLTQALGGDYGHISVYASGVPVNDQLRDVELNAELYDVIAPLSDVLNGNTKSITIGKLDGQVTLKASDIARIAPLDKIENLRIDPSSEEYVETGVDTKKKDTTTTNPDGSEIKDDAKAGVRMSGELQIAGQKVEIFCFAMIELKDGAITFAPKRLQYGNDKETTVVEDIIQAKFLKTFEATVKPGDLPFQVKPTGVKVNQGSVTIKGEMRDVTFAGLPVKGK